MRGVARAESVLVVLLSFLPVGGAAAAAATRVVGVRVQVAPEYTRLEFELDAPAQYTIERPRRTGPGGGTSELVLRFDARGAFPMLEAIAETRLEQASREAQGQVLVDSVRLHAAELSHAPNGRGAGGVAHIRLATRRPQVRHRLLANPVRIVIDVSERPASGEVLAAKAWGSPVGRPRRIVETPADHEQREQLTRRPEEKRPARPIAIPIFERPLVIGGEYEVAVGYERDSRLDRREDDKAELDQKVEIELFYPLSPQLSIFAEAEYRYDWEFHREDGRTRRGGALERGETWLHAANLGGTPLGLRIGRQSLRDEREWWWDEDLDSVQLHYAGDRFLGQLALGMEIGPEATDEAAVAPEEEEVLRLLASARWKYARRHRLEFFVAGQRDLSRRERLGTEVDVDREDEVDADLAWLGLRAMGRCTLGERVRLVYWGDLGVAGGRERSIDFDDAGPGRVVASEVDSRHVLGWAVDAGLTWETRLPGEPAWSLGYAIGSGDRNPHDGLDRSFRQTGLHDNDWKLGGGNRVRYYGELLEPELSNLHVATAAFGVRLLEDDDLTLLYHYYHQVHQTAFQRTEGLRAQPSGRDGSLGHGLDLVLGIERWQHVRMEVVGSLFRAGAAYAAEQGRVAYGARFKFEVGF